MILEELHKVRSIPIVSFFLCCWWIFLLSILFVFFKLYKYYQVVSLLTVNTFYKCYFTVWPVNWTTILFESDHVTKNCETNSSFTKLTVLPGIHLETKIIWSILYFFLIKVLVVLYILKCFVSYCFLFFRFFVVFFLCLCLTFEHQFFA